MMKRYFFMVLFLNLVLWSVATEAAMMSEYEKYPIFTTRVVTPNILITLDNSGSMNFMAYGFESGEYQADNFDPNTEYYGYFDPTASYTYASGVFQRDASYTSGNWDGNFLNWLTMRRVDVARKVLIGGDTQGLRDGSGNTILKGEVSVQTTRRYIKFYENSGSYTPYDSYHVYRIDTDGTFEVFKIEDTSNFDFSKDFSCYCGDCYGSYDWYFADYLFDYQSTYNRFDIELKRWDNPSCSDDHYNHTTYANYVTAYNVWVEKREADEPELFLEGNVAGVIQRIGNRARFGLEHFNSDSHGGYISSYIGEPTASLVEKIENKGCNTATPLAETLYEGVRYYRQDSPYYYSGDYTTDRGGENDPFYYDSEGGLVECGKNFVLLITDGEPTSDGNVPNPPGSGLDDVALWAHTNDMRNDAELPGDQEITLYTVFAFGLGSQLLKDSAINGGYEDINGNGVADGDQIAGNGDEGNEFDKDDDGVPDNYLESESGNELEKKITDAITAILQQTASSTAASVLSTTGEAQGVVLQAYYKLYDEETEARWLGYLKALWVDPWGNIREDSNGNNRLDMGDHLDAGDLIVQFVLDDNNTVTVYKYRDGGDCDPGIENCADGIRDNCQDPGCYPGKPGCSECEADADTSLDDLLPIWEAGKELALREASARVIKTWVDIDGDEVVDSNEFIDFNTLNASVLRPFLGINDSSKTLEENIAEAEKVIEFIRGNDVEGYRERDVYVNAAKKVWKLGDIVNSTPTLVGRPAERMDVLYSDTTYGDFYKAKKDRNIMIYTGANDGMLHAFNGGKVSQDAFTGGGGCAPTDGDELGGEKWAYIPQHLLPHLRWLTDPDYTHVNYVDAKPRIADARIFTSTGVVGDHPQGWGTILVGGMRFGGGEITLTDDFGNGNETRTFRPSYFCMDITNPTNNPTYENLLWEKTHENLGFTTSYPWFVRVADVPAISDTGDWFTIFGSGPTTYEGTSDQNARLFVLDLASGNFTEEIVSEKPNGFMGGPFTIDFNYFGEPQNPYVDGDYSDDMIYVGETYGTDVLDPCVPGDGRMLRISTRGGNVNPWAFSYETDPVNWVKGPLTDRFKNTGVLLPPITATGNATLDEELNLWVFFGTGRFYNECDKSDTTPQYFFNVIDDYWDYGMSDTGVSDGSDANNGDNSPTNLTTWQNMSAFEVTATGAIKDNTLTFVELNNLIKILKGWFVEVGYGENPGERVLTTPHILGGAILFPSFKPEAGICNYGGESFLNALYYETGTAYTKRIIGTAEEDGVTINKKKQDLDKGMSSAISLHQADRAFIQQSSGLIHQLEIDLPFNVKSGIRDWHQP